MAKKDIIKYYLQVQQQYFEMLNTVKSVKGHMSQEQLMNMNNILLPLKSSYEMLSYVMVLLNQPARKDKKLKWDENNKTWYDYLKGSSREAILDENKDVLADLKRFILEETKSKLEESNNE